MATATHIRIDRTKAVIEWQWDSVTRTLANPDPNYDPIQFTVHIDTSTDDGQYRAHFEIDIPFRFKDKPTGASVVLRINPLWIKSFCFANNHEPSGTVKEVFNSAVTFLDFELSSEITVLIPDDVQNPVSVSRGRSGQILDLLYELSRVTAFRIYIQDDFSSLDGLNCISIAAEQRQIEPFSDASYGISEMFEGNGAKPVDIPMPPPP
ncbi:hypothetical protein FHETE_11412, partial [Fusarium heterosporum]